MLDFSANFLALINSLGVTVIILQQLLYAILEN